LSIIFDSKLTFKELTNYMDYKSTKLLFSLSKAAKLNLGLNQEALNTINTGRTLPLLLYRVPVWIKAMEKGSYKSKLERVKR